MEEGGQHQLCGGQEDEEVDPLYRPEPLYQSCVSCVPLLSLLLSTLPYHLGICAFHIVGFGRRRRPLH